jgi:Tol biopolymer transport system component
MTGTRTPLLLGTNDVHLAGQPSITPNGRFIAFTARMESAGGNDDFSNICVYDRALAQLTLVSSKTNGEPANAAFSAPWISADGQTVLFDSFSPDLVANDSNVASDVFVAKLGQTMQVQMNDQQNTLSISWKTGNGGKLQEANSIDGPWTTIENAPEPYVLTGASIVAQKFFRVLY